MQDHFHLQRLAKLGGPVLEWSVAVQMHHGSEEGAGDAKALSFSSLVWGICGGSEAHYC